MQLVFAPNSDALASATQLTVQSSLQQWLGDIINVEGVLVENEESMLTVSVQYLIRRTQERNMAEFRREV